MTDKIELQGFTQDNEELRLLMEVGYFFLDMGRPKDAREVFEGVSAIVPHSEAPLLGIGSAFFNEKKFPQAKKTYEAAITMNQVSGLAYALLGETLIFMNQVEAARRSLKQATDVSSESYVKQFVGHLTNAIDTGILPLKG